MSETKALAPLLTVLADLIAWLKAEEVVGVDRAPGPGRYISVPALVVVGRLGDLGLTLTS